MHARLASLFLLIAAALAGAPAPVAAQSVPGVQPAARPSAPMPSHAGKGHEVAPASQALPFVEFDRRRKLVTMRLVAGYDTSNARLNFNGAIDGDQELVVPVGWTVYGVVVNHDPGQPHSATVITPRFPLDVEIGSPTVRTATTAALAPATTRAARTAEAKFTLPAIRAARYLIACGMPGHAAVGMWIRLTVDPKATEPTYRQATGG